MKLAVTRLIQLAALPLALMSLGTLGSIEAKFDCKSNAHNFIVPLVESDQIETKPMRVESNSVNAFRPTKGTTLTAYGFKVYVVLGYGKDDPLFAHGKEPADQRFGLRRGRVGR